MSEVITPDTTDNETEELDLIRTTTKVDLHVLELTGFIDAKNEKNLDQRTDTSDSKYVYKFTGGDENSKPGNLKFKKGELNVIEIALTPTTASTITITNIAFIDGQSPTSEEKNTMASTRKDKKNDKAGHLSTSWNYYRILADGRTAIVQDVSTTIGGGTFEITVKDGKRGGIICDPRWENTAS